jgi:GTP-binding protein EngB required for normal cell division
MSAIKNLGLKIFSPILLLLIFFSCNSKQDEKIPSKNPDEIISIGYSDVGGSLGEYKIIKITKDSIHLEQGVANNKIHKEWHFAITPQIWKNITSTIDVRTLDKIKSSPSKQSVDGIDETFQIRTPKKSHVYVNSYIDTIHYKQFQELKNQLEIILPKGK